MTELKHLRRFKLIYAIGYGLLMLAIIMLGNKIYTLATGDPEELNKAINDRNSRYARANSFGFTDKERSLKKPKGVYRIAVLGDSFIWGDGLPYEKVWSHKLESKLLAQYDSVEVMHWGLNGWSTLDEFGFYKQHGKDFDVDLLIIAWVDNDLDIGKIPQVHALDPAKEMPVLNKICPPLADAVIGHREDVEYADWVSKIYSEQNLKEYELVLHDFAKCLAGNHTRALYVMTPGPFDDTEQRHFKQMEPILRNSGVACVSLYHSMYQKLRHYNSKDLIANPVNGHPGEVMTEEISTEVKDYLERNGYLKGLHKK